MSESVKNRPAPIPTNMTRPFWQGAADSRLMLQFDPASNRFQFYPRPASLETGKQNLEWRTASGKGVIYSFTITHVPAAGFEDKVPYAIGLVELDEGVRIVANLVNIDPERIAIGQRVRLCWEGLPGEGRYFAFEPED